MKKRNREQQQQKQNKKEKMAAAVSSDELMTSFRKLVIGCKPTGKLQGRRGEKAKCMRSFKKAAFTSNIQGTF